MKTLLGITDLLDSRSLEYTKKCKLVRHKDGRFDLEQLRRDGWVDLYQSIQRNPVFKNCKYIVSFVGDGGGRAKLIGVYEVQGERNAVPADFPRDCPFYDIRNEKHYFYPIERVRQFDDLIDRVVIEWTSERSWHQLIRNRPVVELYPQGRKLLPFADYLDFTLSYRQLCELTSKPKAHRDWHASLSVVSGIYMILAENSGEQYVGSAYGLDGIWGRWLQYATNGHGGNNLLKQLTQHSDEYPEKFRFSILQVLPRTTKKSEVIRWESIFKRKLGSRSFGLNLKLNAG